MSYPTHRELCEMLGVKEHIPSPEWLPYTVRKTKLEVYVEGYRRHVFGGSHVCGTCGFGVDMIPDERTTPKARADGGCPKCGALDVPAEISLPQFCPRLNLSKQPNSREE